MRRDRRLAVGLIVWLVLGCGGTPTIAPATQSPEPAPTLATDSPAAAPSRSPSSRPVDDARRSDLAYLVDQLEAIHPNPYLDEGEAAFRTRVATIEARSPTLTDAGFLVAVMDLMGHRERDGHSGAWAMAQPGERLHAWPIWLWDFPDGLRVVAARASDSDLIGARLVRVGSVTVEEARRTVEPLVPRDNASSLRANLPMYLQLPEVLDELGLREPGGPGLTFELLDGTQREMSGNPLPVPAFHDWAVGVYHGDYPTGLPPDPNGPAHVRNRELAFWSEPLAGAPGRYVGYNFVGRDDGAGTTIGSFAIELRRAAEAAPDEALVLDLRNNPGGDNNTFGPLLRTVEAVARAGPGRVSIIAGRSTFSAAGNFITDLLVGPEASNIRLVGEPPGGGLNIYGDVDVVTLPASGIVVLVSTRYHERARDDDRLELIPDRPAELTWADYAAGRDPVLEAALAP